jgi:hypothetical protein
MTKQTKDTPLATMVINEYKELNKSYVRTNKRLTIIIIFLLVLVAVETTYIVLYWEFMHPNSGIIRKDNIE